MKRIFSMFVGLAVALGALQAQNTVTVNDVELKKGSSVLVSVELTNELAFTAFQIDLKLPDGFDVATTINEDEEEVLDVTLNASRKKSTHQVAPNVLDDGTIRIAAYSSGNAAFKGTSGEIVNFRIVASGEVVVGNYTATLSKMLFSTSDPVAEYDLGEVDFQITYSEEPVIVIPKHSVEVNAGQYGRCVFEGKVIEPNGLYARTDAFEDGATFKLYFVPFEGYTAKSMKRNGEVVAINNNVYEEIATEDVAFTEVNYVLSSAGIEELPTPMITFNEGVVTITCEESDAVIVYAINGDPLVDGSVYVAPFEVTGDVVVSAVAVRSSDEVELNVVASDMLKSQMRVVSQRYYKDNGVEVLSPDNGITIVVTEYEDGSTNLYKMVRK